MEFISPADMPKGVKSKYILQNPKFPKGSYILWYIDSDSGTWKHDLFDTLLPALKQGELMGPSENWVVVQAIDYSLMQNNSLMRGK